MTIQEVTRELAGLLSNGRLVQAAKSVHAIQVQEPEIVIAAVRQVWEAGSQVAG